jgi:hypothetical protein
MIRRPSTIINSSGHIFASIIIKLCQDAYLGNSSDEFKHGLSRSSIVIKLGHGQDACLGNCSDEFEHGSSRLKN